MTITKLQQAVAQFAAKGIIHNTVKHDGVTTVATDSFRLVEIKNVAPDAPEAIEPVYLEGASLKAAKIKNTAEIVKGNGKVFISTPDTSVAVKEGANSFPEYEQIFEQVGDCVEMDVNGKYFSEVLAALSKIHDFEHVTLRIPTKERRPIEVRAKGNNHEARALVMPVVTH